MAKSIKFRPVMGRSFVIWKRTVIFLVRLLALKLPLGPRAWPNEKDKNVADFTCKNDLLF